MSIDIVSQHIDVHQKREKIVLMDSYGATHHLYIAVSTSPADRATQIQNAIATMQANETSLEAVATANGYDLSAQQTIATAQKTTMIAAIPAAVATVAKATVATAVAALTPAATVTATTSAATTPAATIPAATPITGTK